MNAVYATVYAYLRTSGPISSCSWLLLLLLPSQQVCTASTPCIVDALKTATGIMSCSKQPAAYRLLAADELGVLKVIEVPAGPKWSDAAVAQTWGEANKELGITCVACSTSCRDPGTAALVAVGRKGRRIDILDAATGQLQASLTAAAPDKPATGAAASKTHVAAVAFLPETEGRPLQLLAGSSDGTVSICACSSSSDSSSSWSVCRSFQAGNSIACMAVSSCGSYLLLGGEGVQPSIWDFAAGTKLWQAKGGKPNRQTLLVDKPFTTAVAFLPSSSSTIDSTEAAAAAGGEGSAHEAAAPVKLQFVAGSASSKLHVYDTAAGKRPQVEVVFGETRITAVAIEQSGLRIWAANGTGLMQVFDLKARKMLDALKGAGGSVRSLAVHPSGEPLVASVGLDRFVRVHNTNTKSGVCRAYLKQQLTGVCWLPVLQPAGATVGGEAAGATPVAGVADTAFQAAAVQQGRKKKGKKSKREGAAAAEELLPRTKKKQRS